MVDENPAPPNPLRQLTLAQLGTRTSAKWRVHPPDVLPLWVAEMDTPLAEPVALALTGAIEAGDTGYAFGTGYAQALAGFAAQRWGWDGLDVGRTAIVPDVMLGIVEVLRLLTGPGDVVVVNPPVYPPFFSFVEHSGRRLLAAPLGGDGRLDLAALASAFAQARATGRPAVYLLCSPHNPTGTVHTATELAAVASLAGTHGVRVVVDEIHAPLVLPGATFTPYLSVPGAGAGFSLMSASKAWNLAGLKSALLVAGPDAGADLARLPEEVSHGPSHLGVIAHTAALRDGGDWLDALLAGLAANRALLADLLAEYLPQIRYRPPQATFLAWLDCRALAVPDAPVPPELRGQVLVGGGPAQLFLDRGRVALSAGPAFGARGTGHVRLNFATSPEILTEAVQRMAAALA